MSLSFCSREARVEKVDTSLTKSLKLTPSTMKDRRWASGLMDSSGMLRNSSEEMYPCQLWGLPCD